MSVMQVDRPIDHAGYADLVAGIIDRRLKDRAAPPAREAVSLVELLAWAYARQQVAGQLWSPMRWMMFLFGTASPEAEQEVPPVHLDAALVHAVMLGMDEPQSALLRHFARCEEVPDWSTATPTLHPVPCKGSGRHRHQVSGYWSACRQPLRLTIAERRELEAENDHLKRIVTRGEWTYRVDPNPNRRRRNKRDRVMVGPDGAPIVSQSASGTELLVRYCPVVEHPSQAFIDAVNATYDDWFAALKAFAKRLAPWPLLAHAVTELGAVARPRDRDPSELEREAMRSAARARDDDFEMALAWRSMRQQMEG